MSEPLSYRPLLPEPDLGIAMNKTFAPPRWLIGLLPLALLAGCATSPQAPDAVAVADAPGAAETRRLNEWFEARYEEQLQFSPMSLTMLGRRERYDQLDDLSIEAEERMLEWQRRTLVQLQSDFRYALLEPEAKRSYDIWKYQVEGAMAGAPFRLNGYAFDQMNGIQSFLPTFLISFHAVESEPDAVAYVARLRQVGRALDQQLARAMASAKIGVYAPRFAYEGVIEQSRKVVTGAPFDGGADAALWKDLQGKIDALVAKGSLRVARADALKQQGRQALLADVAPAYARLIAWLQSELPNAPVNPTGVGTQPDGDAYYRYRLSQMTTTDLTADAIHELGLREVARLRGEMLALKDRVGFAGDLEAFFTFLDTDPRFRFPNTDAGRQAYIDEATAVIDNIKRELPSWFRVLPKADLVVRRVEPFREQDGAAQHYFPGTPDGSRPGIYYAHLSDMNAMPRTELEVIAYHEGLPGHHMQISIAQELQGIPTFRTQAGFTAYVEGWGLYAEALASEMPNTYRDPYSRFGRLASEMWRAVRLVVDTGLHAKGWTEEQAVQYFDAQTAFPLKTIRSEVQRYLVMPGQATAYKIGMIRIQELRAAAQRQLGSRFDIKGFHDAVLGGGALPLQILDARVADWVATRQVR